MRWIPPLLLLVHLAAACGPPAGPGAQPAASPEATADPPGTADPPDAVDPDAVWFDVLAVSPTAPDHGDVDLVRDAEALAERWAASGFEAEPPAVPFDEQVVLVYLKPEDACPDDLVEVRVADGVLTPTFLPPPGGCEQPLVPTAYAVALHRGDLPERLTVRIPQHEGHGGDVEETFDLPPYDGPPAPAPSPPPRQMGAAEVDALFADAPLRRCEELPDFRTEVRVDGPLSEDPEVAAAQQGRAELALPSDEATVRALLDDPDADHAFGFPMTPAEHDEVMARNRMDVLEELERYRAEHAGTFGFMLLDQPGGGVVVVGVTDDLEGHRERLAERFPDVPLRVVEAPATQAQLEAAQEALLPLMGLDEAPRVSGAGLGAGHLAVSVVDPTREDLDAIAAVTDPAFTCVDVELSGLPPRP